VATPSPSPEPATSAGPTCSACGDEAVVNWRRRPTSDELAEHVTAEQSRRDQALLLADPQLPAPVFPPLPTSDDTTRTIYSCGAHAITMDAAALIHAATCTAPNEADLPGCNCTPEPLPAPEPEPADAPAPSRLPAHWLNEGT
jgi:hypothetical protein